MLSDTKGKFRDEYSLKEFWIALFFPLPYNFIKRRQWIRKNDFFAFIMFIFLVIYIKTERLKWFFKEIYHSIIYLVHFINQPRDRALQLLFQKCICFTKHPDRMIKQFYIDPKLF